MIGVGWAGLFFKVIFLHASETPRVASANSHICSGFSGLPKHRQSVTACGVSPTAATFLIASTTELTPPQYGLIMFCLGLWSVDIAIPIFRISSG